MLDCLQSLYSLWKALILLSVAKLSKAVFSFILTQSAVWAGVHEVWAGLHAVWAGLHTVLAGGTINMSWVTSGIVVKKAS